MKTSAVSVAAMAMLLAILLGMPNVVTAQGAGQDTLIVGVQNDTPNLHPWDVATNSVWKSFIWRQWVYEGLYGLSPDGTIYPILAQSITVNGMNITVTIRSGVRFTDGQPMTADDVIFTFQTLAFNSQLSDTILKSITWQDPPMFDRWNASTPWGSTHLSHVGIIKVNANTVRFQLRQNYSMFYFGTLTTPIMPSHIWQNHLVEVDLSTGGFVIPGGVTLSSGNEFDLDRNFGATSSDVQATIGTGPWYLIKWTPLSSAELGAYDGYWGKSQSLTWQGKQWPFYPNNLRKINFKIYGTLDVAILALKSGEVHMVPWDLPPGFYNDLRRDPRMGFGISAADGFFYLAFNMRRAPMNDLDFRKAVSYAVDKDFIVNRLLAGFGIKGQLPMSPINPAYINSSANAPPFDLTQAASILDAAGYLDANSDGWREMPDGSPLKLSILTPAKDYDPVRADSGIMIANNLKQVGLNIDSSPTAFDAIVSAVFVAVQFDMYILGWVSLGPFPELYFAEFFACQSDVLLGVGSNSPGYCNAEFEQKMDILDRSMDDAERIQAAKDAEGILARDLPYDTLYSKRWIEGYRQDIWGGWISVNGEIFNGFSIGVLGPPVGPSVPTGPLTISLDGPGQAIAGATVKLHAYVVQAGRPANGVDVNVTAMTGEWKNGTTGANGFVEIDFPMPYVAGAVDFVATARLGSDTGGDILRVNLVLPNDISQVLLSTPTPVIAAGGTATVTAKVVDRTGTGIAGVPVNIIPELVLGSITPTQGTTDSSGITTFTYTAPAGTLITNRNHYDYIKATVDVPNKPKVIEVKTQTLAIGVENPSYNWLIVDVQSVSAYVVDTNGATPIPATSTVTVSVKDQTGAAVVGEEVTATVSAPSAMTIDQATQQTGAGGTVQYVFTANTATSTPVSVNFTLKSAFYARAGLSLLVTDGVAADYAFKMDLPSKFVDPNTAATFTATVYDNTGAAASGVEVDAFIPYNEIGNPVSVTLPEWTFIGSVGSVFTNTTDTSGQVTTSFSTKTFAADSVITIEAGIAGFGPMGAFILGSPTSMYFYQGVVEKRNKLATVESFIMEDPILHKDHLTTNITVTYKSGTGIASGMAVRLYRGLGDLRPGRGATLIGSFTTDSQGKIRAQWTEPAAETDRKLGFTTILTDTNYALGGQLGSVPFEAVFAYLVTPADPTGLFPTGAPASTIVKLGASQSYTITVKDFTGLAVQDAIVKADIAGSLSGTTVATGQVTLTAAPGSTNPTATDVWETLFTITKGSETTTIQLGTLVGVGIAQYSNLVVPGSGKVGEAATISVDVQNVGPVADNLVVTLNVDGAVYAAKVVAVNPGQTVTVSFTWVPSDTAAHAFSVGTLTGSLTASAVAGGLDMTVGVLLMIVLLIVGIVIGFFIGKMKKAPPPVEAPMEISKETPIEEEKPPEGQS